MYNFSFVTVPSSRTALVCLDNQLTLTCSSNSTGLQWAITHPSMSTGVGSQFITSTGREVLPPIVTNQAVYRFSRISISPLVSVLQVDVVNATIDGTMVDCYGSSLEGKLISTTVINIIGKLRDA